MKGKLVRDRIPDLIRADGVEPVTYTAEPAEYRERLRAKLSEEVTEFLQATDQNRAEELADVLEVIYALAHNLGIDVDQLEHIRAQKAQVKGGFEKRIVWVND